MNFTLDNDHQNLASKFYDVFIGKGKEEQLEIDNSEDIISKDESRARITILQLFFGFLCVITSTLLVYVFEYTLLKKITLIGFPGKLSNINPTTEIDFLKIYISLESDAKPNLEKKLILFDNKYVIEYNHNQISKESFPIKLYNNSYGFTHQQDLYFLHLQNKFVQKRIKFKERHIYLDNAMAPQKVASWQE